MSSEPILLKGRDRSRGDHVIRFAVSSLFFLIAAIVIMKPLPTFAAARTASVSGNWSNTATWGGAAVPVAGDNIIVNTGITVTVDVNTAAVTTIVLNAPAANNGITISGTNTLNATGAITMNSPTAGVITQTIDVGAGTLNAASIAIPGSATAGRYCTLSLSTGTVNVSGAITTSGTAAQSRITFTGAGTIYVGGNFASGTFTPDGGSVNFNGGTQSVGGLTYNNVTFSGSGTKTLAGATTINGNLLISGVTLAAGTFTHNIAGNWTNNGTFTANTATINFNGAGALQTISGSSATTFYILQVSKGAQNRILEATSLIGLSAGTNPLVITSGTFKLSSASTITPFTTGAGATIPAAGGFWNNGGTINAGGFTWVVNGLFQNSAGTTNIGTSAGNSLTYSSGSTIIISGGNVNVAGRFSRNGTNGSTVTYTQSGGTLTVVTVGSISATRAGFDIGASGSIFNMSNGSIVIQKPTSNASDYLNLALTNNVTGGTLQIGNASTAGAPVITIDSSAPIYNLTLNTTGSPTARLVTDNLTVGNNVTIGTGTTLDAGTNAINMNVAGDWTNGGTFTGTGATVNLNKSGAQVIGGSAVTTFNNLTLSGSGAKTASSNVTVNGILNLSVANPSATAGLLDMGANTLTMGGSATTIGQGDVTGIVKRTTLIAGTTYTFGNQYTSVNFQNIGTLPTDVSVKIAIGSAPAWKTNAIRRTYDFIHTGGSGCYATVNAHYLDTELATTTENKLVWWASNTPFTPGTEVEYGRSNYDTTNNWVGLSSVPISIWTTSFGQQVETLGDSMLVNATWNGSVDSDWVKAANWTPNGVPSDSADIVIPDAATTPNDPVMPVSLAVGRMTIESGAILNAMLGSTVTVSGASGAWSDNGGTFNHNSDTVVFTNAAATVSGSTDFYNFTINPGAAVTMGSGGMMRIRGTMTNNGTWRAAQLSGTTVEYNGAGQTVLNPNGLTPGYDNLVLSGTGAKLMPATVLSVLGNFSVTGTASATAGNVINTTGNLSVGPGATYTMGAYTDAVGGNLTNQGTFTATGGTINLDGSFTSDNTFTLTGGTLSLKGDFTNNSILTLTGSTVNFNGTASQTIGGTIATAFNTINITNTTAAVTVANNFSTVGAMTVNSGARLNTDAYVITGASFTLASGGTLGIGSTAGISAVGATGNIQTTVRNYNAGANYVYNGTANQIAGGGLPVAVNGLAVNNTGGAGNDTVTLGGNTQVNGTLALTSGKIATGANYLYIFSTGNVTGGSAGSHVVGNLKKYIATGATAKTFEIGDGTNYTPVGIQFGNVTGVGDLTITTTAGDHPNIATSNVNPGKSVNRYWSTTNSGITFDNYGATFNFINPGDLDAGADPANFIVGKWSGAAWSYPTVGTKNISDTQATGLISFSDFQLGEFIDYAALAVAADKAALVDNDIKGANPDLAHITVHLTNPLPSIGSASGSAITWFSSASSTVSADGQTIVRPIFSAGDASVNMTAHIASSTAWDTKVFALTVLKLPASTDAKVTSGVYTVSGGSGPAETIVNVPYNTSKATFESNLSKSESHSSWNDAGIHNPVLTGDTLVATAEDGVTSITYTVTVLPDPGIAAVAADKAALVDNDIKGANPDLAHITVHLTNPLPSIGSASGSAITWFSSATGTVSADGQMIVRPIFSAGDASVNMTAHIASSTSWDTKVFTLTVLKLPASTDAKVTSGSYTVSGGSGPAETIVDVPFATPKATFLANLTKSESHSSWNSAGISNPVLSGDTLVVTAEDGVTQITYTVTVLGDPAIAAVAADKAALVDNDIRDANPDLAHITVHLTNPLPSIGSASGSAITWASDATTTVSNDGQTVVRPIFSAGDATVHMTATIASSTASDTKIFTLTVLKLPASTDAKVTSGSYTVSGGSGPAETIVNVPVGTPKATFLANLAKSESHSSWNSVGISNPVLSGDTLIVTAEDGVTQITYTVTVDATAPVISAISASPSDTGASINWTTNVLASTKVVYSTDLSYSSVTTETDMAPRVTGHSKSLTGLSVCTVYHYKVVSRDAALNSATSTDRTFTTTGCSTGGGGGVSMAPAVGMTVNGQTVPLDFTIDNGASETQNNVLDLALNADPTTVRGYAVSLDPQLADTSLNNFASNVTFALPDVPGTYRVYLRYYSVTGQPSEILSHSIAYKVPAGSPPAIVPIAPVVLLDNLTDSCNPAIADQVLAQVKADAKEFDLVLSDGQALAIRNFIVCGNSPASIKFGSGERRAIMRDYMETVHRSETVWSDIERLATGQIPLTRNLALERLQVSRALPVFRRIFGHDPNFDVYQENLAWNTLLYRIRFPRDLVKEAAGFKIYYAIYQHDPTSPFSWSVIRVLGYVKT